jgi:hypothetical protein
MQCFLMFKQLISRNNISTMTLCYMKLYFSVIWLKHFYSKNNAVCLYINDLKSTSCAQHIYLKIY